MTENNLEKVEVCKKFFLSVFVIEPDWTWMLRDEEKTQNKKSSENKHNASRSVETTEGSQFKSIP